MRSRTLLLLAAAATLVPVAGGGLAGVAGTASGAPHATASTALARSPGLRARAILRRWDLRRGSAWASDDPTALAALYAPGSLTGAADAAELRRWSRRGLRVTGLRQQVTAFRVVARRRGRLVVVVTDRTVGGAAVGGGRILPLPPSEWATQRIRLRRAAAGWQVVEVVAQPAR